MKTTSANRHLLCVALLVYGLAAAMPAFPQSRGLAKFEKAKTHFRQGMVYFNNMRYLAAVDHFRKAVAVYPDYNTAREYLARSYRLAGFRDEALTEWEFLSGIAENNVLIQHKIDMLRLQETGMAAEGFAENEFVLADEYKSADLKRFRFPNPVDVAVDAEKNIYITSFSAGKLVKFDPNKEGEAVFGPGLDSRLYGIDCSGRRLVVSDFQKDRVYIMNTRPAIVKTLARRETPKGAFTARRASASTRAASYTWWTPGTTACRSSTAAAGLSWASGNRGSTRGSCRTRRTALPIHAWCT